MSPVNIRIPDELRDRIDGHRPATVSREAWVRAACERALLVESHHRPATASVEPSTHWHVSVPPPVGGELIDTATGHETPVVQGATVTSADLIVKEAPVMCHTCRKSGPPRSGRPCPSCGTTGPKVRK